MRKAKEVLETKEEMISDGILEHQEGKTDNPKTKNMGNTFSFSNWIFCYVWQLKQKLLNLILNVWGGDI